MSTTAPHVLDSVPVYALPSCRGPYRLADYLELPDEPRVELINGNYHMSPAPITLHQIISLELSYWLHGVAKQSGGFALAAPTDVVLADDSCVQPDLLYFRKERRPPLGPRIELPPDLVIEILSPSHRAHDRVTKAALYAEHGVAEYWLVDPAEQSFEFFVLVDGKYQLQPQSRSYTSPVCPELTIDQAAFWNEIDKQITPPQGGE